MTMINPEPDPLDDDELAGIVDLDRGTPEDCTRIPSTLGGPEHRLQGRLGRINEQASSR